MKRIYKGAAVIAASVLAIGLLPKLARSADHLDGPEVKKDPATDINDLYSWVDGGNAIFALTVYPQATATSKFSDKVQYVIHTSSAATFGAAETATDIICTFDTAQKITCWAGADEYVTGDASAEAGITSTSGKFKVFAGRRADPFFFNLDGFKHTVATVKAVAGGTPTPDFDAGCPLLNTSQRDLLVGQLGTAPDGTPAVDFFKDLSGLAIVVSVEKSVVTKGGPIVASWASTNKAQ